ncbi:M1 family metallopeptidase [Silanimonas sp.]|uniref:M1 family metallopeptidase n=1 Tax=Silanimonas sp. TaxID=1929290 RepID=UPI001BB9D241|nr:M1 family metallopeptidase [Silanimonas sp.]MBS3896480.1 M1 family metallopeptidase [Silanimonas sp.]MBS3924436.1 M1 family metallopeptidase [Xanthomonadaceae bacterium]
MRLLPALALAAFACLAHATDRAHDEHSVAEPKLVRITATELDLRVDFDQRSLRGQVTHRLAWTQPEWPGPATLQLDTRDLSIERVQARNPEGRWQRVEFSLGERDPILGSPLRIELPARLAEVRIRYRTSPEASGLQWLPPALTAGGRKPLLFSQSQAIHARSWVPLQDTPGVRFTYTARIRTAPGLMALMSADNDPAALADGDFHFTMPQPIPSYLLAVAVGDFRFQALSERAGIWAEPSLLERAVAEFADTERMIQVAESLYGPYRWGRYDLLVLPASFPFGGMENPRLSFITPTIITGDRSLVSLIAHELAHSWSGNLVTNASWKDFWLNEGFTTYVENRIIEALFGAERAAMETAIGQAGLREALASLPPERQVLALPPLPGRDPEEVLTDVAYVKGQWFLQFLEQRFGRESFDAFLRRWFDAHAFQSVTTDDFLAFLRRELMARQPGRVSEAEIAAWIAGPGLPPSATPAVSTGLAAVDAARADWLERRSTAADLDTAGWITWQWVHFLEGLPADIAAERLVELDAAFRFTGTPNGEIAQRWYPITVRAGYFEARPALAQFLRQVGRRKLILPTYAALAETPDGLAFARQLLQQAGPGYHPITRASVQALLDAAPR